MPRLTGYRDDTRIDRETGLTDQEQAAYEAEADAYFAALDYGFTRSAVTRDPEPLPIARTLNASWWRRLLAWLW